MKKRIYFDKQVNETQEEIGPQETLMERLIREAEEKARQNMKVEMQEAEQKKAELMQEAEQKKVELMKEADLQIARKRKELDDEFRKKNSQMKNQKKQFEKEMQETRQGLETLQEEACKKLEERERAIQDIINKTNKQIQSTNSAVNARNHDTAVALETNNRVKRLEEELAQYKSALERILGREVNIGDLQNSEREQGNEEASGIQELRVYNPKSVFEYSVDGKWTEIGHVVLEESVSSENFKFGDRQIIELISKNRNMEVCRNGFVIGQPSRINVVAVRLIIKDGDKYKNVYKFYSSSQVVPIYKFLDIANFIIHIHSTKLKTSGKPIEASIECLIYSDKKHKNSQSCTFRKAENNIYRLKYCNSSSTNFEQLAGHIYTCLNCSKKNVPENKISLAEETAFTLNMQLLNSGQDWIKNIPYITSEEDGR